MRVQIVPDKEVPVLELALQKAPARDAAAVGLLLYCGLRCHEVCDLTWQDVFFGGELNTAVQVKTSHEPINHPRLVDIPEKLGKLLTKHHATAAAGSSGIAPRDPLFRTAKAKGRFQNRDLERICHKITLGALGKPYTPRTLRHTYATRMMKHANIRIVQELLGHRSLQSTQIYTHPTSDDCRQAVNQAFK